MSMIHHGFEGMSEEKLRKMSQDQLVRAILRMMEVPEINCQSYYGTALLPDKLAKAFIDN